jgi:glucan phosphoethanolaminetransferase (alkaline phosphatase superfamily)
MDQQDTQAQQQNKKGVFIDFETLREVKSSIDNSFMLTLIIALLAFAGFITINNIVAQIVFLVIMIFSVFAMGIAASSYNKLDKFTPKVKKIIKEIIFYEDGQVEEKETKYE